VTRRWAPPIAAFLLHRLLLAAAAWASGADPAVASSWVRWDSGHYLSIATSGYVPPSPCPPESGYPPSAWCGNAAWFPGYPWVVAGLAHVGLPLVPAAVLVSAVAQLGCLVLVWRLLDDERQWPALGLAAFFFGNVYLAAVFPMSLVLLAALACIGACWRGRFGLAALAGAAAATCYPTAVLLGPVVLAWAVLHRRWRALSVPAAVAIGYGGVLLALQRQAGAWDAFFRVQAKYGYTWDALDTLGARLKGLVNPKYRDARSVVTGVQTALSTLLIATLAYQGGKRALSERNSLVLLYLAAFWLAPLTTGGQLSLYRSEVLLLPAVFLVPQLPRWFQLAAFAAAVLLSMPMAMLFFRGVLK
jgi:hypothetical protein